MKKVAAVIHFEPGVTDVQVLELIATLQKKGILQNATVKEYDDKYGDPVWYIP